MSIFWEIRVACRSLRRNPGYLLATILPVVAGVALATAVVTTAIRVFGSDAGLHPDGEVRIVERSSHDSPASQTFSRRDVQALEDGPSAPDFAVVHQLSALVKVSDDVRRTGVALVSGTYFSILGVKTMSGVALRADDVTETRRVAVVSAPFWRAIASRQSDLSSVHLQVNGVVLEVAGVAPSGFRGTDAFAPVDVWMPLSLEPELEPAKRLYERPDAAWLSILCRIPPRAHLTALSEYLAARLGRHSREQALRVRLAPLGQSRGARPFSMFLALVAVGVGALLLVTCGNVATLMLARSLSGVHHRAIRNALGCSRWRSSADIWIEGGLLAVVAAALGATASFWIAELLIHAGPVAPAVVVPSVAPWITIAAATTTAVLISALCVTFAVVCVPDPRLGIAEVLTSEAGSSPRTRNRHWLVVVQLSLACSLLFLSSLLFRTTLNVAKRDLGFEPNGLFVSRVERGPGAPELSSWCRRLLVTTRSKQGVQDATVAAQGPLSSGASSQTIEATGDNRGGVISSGYDMVGPHYCRTTGLRLLGGRDLAEQDDRGASRVLLVNESLSRALWPGRSPIGQTVGIATERGDFEVVGVTADSVSQTLVEPSGPFFYVPVLQTSSASGLQLLVRSVEPAAVVGNTLASVGRELGAGYSLAPAESLREKVRGWTATTTTVLGWLVGVAGVISLLAAYGVYSLNSYIVESRRRELAIAVAMGASARDVLCSVLTDAARIAAISFGGGVLLALAMGGLFRHVLYGVAPIDPVSLVMSAAVLSIVGVGACVPPAWRASRIDAWSVLKEQ